MSAVALVAPSVDVRRSLARTYRRLLRVPITHKVLIGLIGSLAVSGVCWLANLSPVVGLLVWLLGGSVITDLLWRRIFNWMTAPAAGLVLAVQLLGWFVPELTAATGLPDRMESLAGLGLCLGLMLILYFAFRGGEGDVKLVAVLGAILGPWDGIEVAIGGYLLAAIVALGILAYRVARRVVTGRPSDKKFTAGTLPMAPFFATAAVLGRFVLGGM